MSTLDEEPASEKFSKQIVACTNAHSLLAQKMRTVAGEIVFGGRSFLAVIFEEQPTRNASFKNGVVATMKLDLHNRDLQRLRSYVDPQPGHIAGVSRFQEVINVYPFLRNFPLTDDQREGLFSPYVDIASIQSCFRRLRFVIVMPDQQMVEIDEDIFQVVGSRSRIVTPKACFSIGLDEHVENSEEKGIIETNNGVFCSEWVIDGSLVSPVRWLGKHVERVYENGDLACKNPEVLNTRRLISGLGVNQFRFEPYLEEQLIRVPAQEVSRELETAREAMKYAHAMLTDASNEHRKKKTAFDKRPKLKLI